MECEKVDISVLVVDDDNISLAALACMLESFQYKVLIANNGYEALETLREYEGFVDIIITDLQMPAMNGLELQKLINKEFQIPVIVMSEDRRKCVRTKSLESGAVGFMVKPMRPDDLKNVWQYAVAARKGKAVANEELGTSDGQSSISSEVGNVGDVNSDKSLETKPKRGRKTKGNKRKASESESTDTNKDMSEKNGLMPLKKPKVVWTTELHNQFLMAIKQIGLSKAVPKRILVLMNVPGLTRENVASHLQKYRIFLRKVSQIGAMKGLSDRVLRSKFASGLINDIRKRTTQIRLPVHHQHMRSTSSRGTAATTNSSVFHVRTSQLPIPLHRRSQNLQTQLPPRVSSSLNNQVRLDNSSFGIIGSNAIQTNNHYFQQQLQQPILGHYQNPPHQANQTYNAGASLLAYGGEGLMECNDMNYVSFGNSRFNYAPSTGNLGYFGNINLSQNSTNNCHPSNGFQLNDGRLTMAGMNQTGVNTSVGIAALEGNNNSFGLINDSSNMHSNPQEVTNGFGLSNFTIGTPNAMMPATPTGNNNGRMDQLGLSNVTVPPYENNTIYGFTSSASNAIMPIAKTWKGRIVQAGLHSVVGEPVYGNNSFGFNNGTPNAIMPIAATTDGDSGLCQASAARVRSGSELRPPVINNVIQDENVSGLPPLAEQLDYLPSALTNNATQEGNISELPLSSEQSDGLRNTGNENQYCNFNPLSQGLSQLYSEDDLSELFFMLDNMHHLDGEQDGELQVPNFFMFPTQTGENSDGGEFINPGFSNSCHAEQYLEQPQGINEFVGLGEQLSRYIVDNAASASNSRY